MSTMVVSYAVMPSGEQETEMRFFYPGSKFSDALTPKYYDGSPMKSDMDDDIEQPLSKRTNLKRLVILSARGFGKK
ncbi:hypothetical protein B9Z55_020437 [Caenorhabditis nigoni]|nr:hypothetical protein B9Z55_020437 [Caenorhabditis nigoni]